MPSCTVLLISSPTIQNKRSLESAIPKTTIDTLHGPNSMTSLESIKVAIQSLFTGTKLSTLEPTQSVDDSFEIIERRSEEREQTSKIVFPDSCDLLQIEGDRCVGVCFANEEGFYGVRSLSTKRVAVATGKHGLHYIDWDPVEEDATASRTSFGAASSQACESFASPGSLYRAFEDQKWPSLDWVKASSVLDDKGTPMSMRSVVGGPLKSHPSSSLFLSGCNTDHLLLWRYGVGVPAARLSVGRSGNGIVRRCAWSDSGDRIAAMTESGQCVMWDVIHARWTTALPDWTLQAVPKKGYDINFVHGSGSTLVTSGEDDVGRGLFSLWDTLAPPPSCRVAHLEYRHPLTEIATIPGTLIFLTAQSSGSINAHDLRMLGTSDTKLLWSLNWIHDGPVTCLEVGWAPSPSRPGWELTVASGGSDGDVCLSNRISESGYLSQRLSKAHWKKPGQLASLLFGGLKGNLGNVSVPPFGMQRHHPESATGLPVMDIDWCDEGLLTAGGDGFVQLFPFCPHQVPCVRPL